MTLWIDRVMFIFALTMALTSTGMVVLVWKDILPLGAKFIFLNTFTAVLNYINAFRMVMLIRGEH